MQEKKLKSYSYHNPLQFSMRQSRDLLISLIRTNVYIRLSEPLHQPSLCIRYNFQKLKSRLPIVCNKYLRYELA